MKLPHSFNVPGLSFVASLLLTRREDTSLPPEHHPLDALRPPPTAIDDLKATITLPTALKTSCHVAAHKANIRLLRATDESQLPEGITTETIAALFSGAGVYIGPEDTGIRGGCAPKPASHVAAIRDELLHLTQMEFPRADKLYVLGPHYEFGRCETPSPACPERGFFFGLDKAWPRELLEPKLSWGICLGLWDSAYYMTGRDDTVTLAQRYEETASAIYNNMADRAALLVSTLMWQSADSFVFERSFRKAGWKIGQVGSYGADPLLLVKGV